MIALLLLTALETSTATPSEKDLAIAKNLFESGTRAYEAGRYEVAIGVFEAAYKTVARPSIAYALAQAFRLQYFVDRDPAKLKRAIELYRIYLIHPGTTGAATREHAATHLAALERLEPLKPLVEPQPPPRAPPAAIIVTSRTPNARVMIDGRGRVDAPAVLETTPGEHTIRVWAEHHDPAETKVVAIDAQTVAVHVDLVPLPAYIQLRAPKGAELILDGLRVGHAPLPRKIEAAPGPHQLAVLSKGTYAFTTELTLEPGQHAELDVELKTTTQRYLSLSAGGAGVVLAVLAGGLGLTALSPENAAQAIEATAAQRSLTEAEVIDHQRFADQRDARVFRSAALGGAAAAFLITAAALYLFDDP